MPELGISGSKITALFLFLIGNNKMANNDSKITDPMWRLWEDRPNKAWRLGGIAVQKKGYHGTVNFNLEKFPDNYSIKLPLDLVGYNRDFARAIDTTKSDAEMRLWTKRMRDSALNPLDHRLAAVKEFYGTLDSVTVYGLTKDTENGPWRRSSADKTHLWHGHKSIFTAFVNNWDKLSPILSVESGQSFSDWSGMDLPKLGDSGEVVKYWQHVHNTARQAIKPIPPITLEVDGDYGPKTAAAVLDFWKKNNGSGTFKGERISGWLAFRYHIALSRATALPAPAVPDDQLKTFVNEWLTARIPNLKFTGDIEGRISL